MKEVDMNLVCNSEIMIGKAHNNNCKMGIDVGGTCQGIL